MKHFDFTDVQLPPLQKGSHTSPKAGLCAMEMIAFMERLPHSDAPACTCPVIAAYVRVLNDEMPDRLRPRLLPYLSPLVGSVAPDYEVGRAQFFASVAREFAAAADAAADAADAAAYAAAYAAADAAVDAAGYAAYAAAYAADAAAYADAARAARADAAAARAADAARAATYAHAVAADAVAAARGAAYTVGVDAIWQRALDAIDGALAIGPEPKGFTDVTRAADLAELCK
jgi:hypothetical protein